MGIFFQAKHLDDSTLVECGYMSYGWYRMSVAEAIDPLFGMMYNGYYRSNGWETDEAGRQYTEGRINIDDYIKENIEIENKDQYGSYGELPPEVKELENHIYEFTYGSAIDQVRVQREFFTDPSYILHFRLSWDKMCDWVDDHLSEAQQNLLFAPDSEGKWSWQECREMYKAYKDLDVKYHYRQSYDHIEEMHSRMLASWKACWKNRCQLRWS